LYKWDTLFGKEETQRVQAAEMLYYVLNELARMSGDFIAHKSRLKAQADMLRREKRAREEKGNWLYGL
jgi:hypothetical protein